jgi:putative transcriptional regulator
VKAAVPRAVANGGSTPRFSIHDAPPPTPEQVRRIEAASDEEIARMAAEDGTPDLSEAPDDELRVVRSCPDPRRIRERLGLARDAFARAFGIDVWTLGERERGEAEPEGPARTLLRVIDLEPDAVRRAVAGA